ncbi:MAG TPA: hypothetical protein VFC54_09245 [Pseudolabrys sp.]|nr:hypothetical protein [Pseudolabrys sp.]
MPETSIEIESALHARLAQWAKEQQRPLPALVQDILIAAERVRAGYDPTTSWSTRIIRRDRDGGCGLCEGLEPLFATGKTEAPTY